MPGRYADGVFALPIAAARRPQGQEPMLRVVAGPHDLQPLAALVDRKAVIAEEGRPGLPEVKIFDVLAKGKFVPKR